jgi:hypothetical protein
MLKGLTPLFLIFLSSPVAAQAVASGATTAHDSESSFVKAADVAFRQLLYLPAPPPRTAQAQEEGGTQKKRASDFFDEGKAPPDDASAEDLVDYWERWANTSGNAGHKPSAAVRRRLLAACESQPEKLPRLLSLFHDDAETAERVKKLYDATQGSSALDEGWREGVLAELQVLAAGSGAPQGVAAIILADDALAQGIMASNDEPAQLALLACARLTRTPLPVEQVGALLRSKNPELQLAAERYLLAEDGEEARSLLWARHPGEAFITGWRENVPLIGGSDFSAMDGVEQKLRAELYEEEDAPLEVFALFGNGGRPLHVLRVYPGSAVYTHYEDATRYRERAVTVGELGRFKNFVTTNNLLDLGPQIGPCHYDCWVTEFLSLRREGGRRVFSHRGAGAWATLLANFELLGREGAKIHYRLEGENKGTREGRWWAGRRQVELRQVPLRRLR